MYSNYNVNAEGETGHKSYVVTTDTDASVTITRPDNITGLPERELTRLSVL
jgi:hypothetical protein